MVIVGSTVRDSSGNEMGKRCTYLFETVREGPLPPIRYRTLMDYLGFLDPYPFHP